LVHRRAALRPTVKYWLKPDVENRIAEGAITALFEAVVTGFGDGRVEVTAGGEPRTLPADAVYILAGYQPDLALARDAGVAIDAATGIPAHDPQSCESNVPGLYIAGTLQAGFDTHKIFIENSREHAPRLVAHLVARLAQGR